MITCTGGVSPGIDGLGVMRTVDVTTSVPVGAAEGAVVVRTEGEGARLALGGVADDGGGGGGLEGGGEGVLEDGGGGGGLDVGGGFTEVGVGEGGCEVGGSAEGGGLDDGGGATDGVGAVGESEGGVTDGKGDEAAEEADGAGLEGTREREGSNVLAVPLLDMMATIARSARNQAKECRARKTGSEAATRTEKRCRREVSKGEEVSQVSG